MTTFLHFLNYILKPVIIAIAIIWAFCSLVVFAVFWFNDRSHR